MEFMGDSDHQAIYKTAGECSSYRLGLSTATLEIVPFGQQKPNDELHHEVFS